MSYNPPHRPNVHDRVNQKLITIRIDEEIRDEFKKLCEEDETSMQIVIEEFIKNYIKTKEQ